LAGLLIVSDEQEKNLQLPSQYGVDDLPLILQDRQFEEGTLVLPQGMMATMHGRRGDTLLANGVPNPVARVPRRLVRLRLVNGSNARTFDLAFDDERAFHWIASEGGLLNRPVELRSLTLTPGERAEIIVDFSDGRPVKLETGPDTSVPMMMGMMAQASNAIGVGRGTLVNFAPEGERGVEVNLPAHLGPQEWAKASDSVRRRQFTMNMGMGMMGGMMGSRGGMGGMMRGGSAMFGINGRAYDMARIDEEVRLGDVEIWEVHSEMMAHPFHVHGVHFQVLRRNGGDPHPRDQGLFIPAEN
jgi:FtsP/CotA-like multicopper oxidase with cupredoxin domain